mmetsp:Transcript_27120/g.76523  ORF Transcript_27120/g.76523 Transcript_27120/m.76523 type:complete len:468 (-) Transcript_27120:372-1775(-)|eukprot:CAMPEP_0117683440 /NCGR_PEP_ID=MMETSP0804-20121206/20396_1 /TAXON_ID=1074897 /ORGANISM="Tetraselmis astigmatica, Strain CCMP880" /LENGTH=467 /DNA_ID=CAMNT_0005494023 /DNA_START=342 /DNA_END=1748 /DNA_ORIENTATION=+
MVAEEYLAVDEIPSTPGPSGPPTERNDQTQPGDCKTRSTETHAQPTGLPTSSCLPQLRSIRRGGKLFSMRSLCRGDTVAAVPAAAHNPSEETQTPCQTNAVTEPEVLNDQSAEAKTDASSRLLEKLEAELAWLVHMVKEHEDPERAMAAATAAIHGLGDGSQAADKEKAEDAAVSAQAPQTFGPGNFVPDPATYMDAYPACKRLVEEFRSNPSTFNKTPLAILHEYAIRTGLELTHSEEADTILGPFTAESKLAPAGASTVFALGRGRGRSKKDAKQVAAAAMLENLLEKVPSSEFQKQKAQPKPKQNKRSAADADIAAKQPTKRPARNPQQGGRPHHGYQTNGGGRGDRKGHRFGGQGMQPGSRGRDPCFFNGNPSFHPGMDPAGFQGPGNMIPDGPGFAEMVHPMFPVDPIMGGPAMGVGFIMFSDHGMPDLMQRARQRMDSDRLLAPMQGGAGTEHTDANGPLW